MSLDVCLPDLERKGAIDVGRSKEARELYDELRTYYGRTHSPDAAAALASQKTVERLEGALAHKQRNLVRQAKVQSEALLAARRYDGGDPTAGGPIPPKGVEALFGFDGRAGHNNNVESRQRVIRGAAHSILADVLERHHTNVAGQIRHRAELDDVVKETFKPGVTGELGAREFADAVAKSFDYLRARFNEAGGQIGKIEGGYMPQSHSSRLVRKAGFDQWRSFILPLLDRGRMLDRRTGEPFTDQALELALRDTFETIRTDGWSSIKPGAAGGKMLANQRAEHRFLHFTDGDAWLQYHEHFGEGTAFDAIMGHVDGMSRDIAQMEILGPNPPATVKWLQDQLVKTAQLDGSPESKAIEHANAGAKRIDRLYRELDGTLNRPESRGIALGFSALRSFQTAGKLGSAIISALPTDPAFGAITRAFNGLPVTGMLRGYLRQLASPADRKFAVRAGLVAEEWAHHTAGAHRVLSEELTGTIAQRLAAGVLRISGLAHYTQAGRWAFGMEALGHLTDESGKSFDQLAGALRGAMQRHGISAADWDAIRSAPLETHKGAGWILPSNVADRGAADRLMQWLLTETDYAVPVADLRTRAMLNSMAPKGTWTGEIARSALLFKTFGISLLATHGRRMIENAPASALGYGIAFLAATTLGGLAALELKEIAKGRDPRPIPGPDADPIDHAQLWGAAMAQGGGFGIFGDFLSSSQNRFGGGVASTIAGPLAGTAQGVAQLGGDLGRKALGGKANPGNDLVRLLKSETPGSSLWYSRLAFERLMADQLQAEVDPNYRQSWRGAERRAKKNGQGIWWAPGETSPERAPDFGNAWGGNDQ